MHFFNNFSHPSSATRPPNHSIGLLKSRQNPSVQALFGELTGVQVAEQNITWQCRDMCCGGEITCILACYHKMNGYEKKAAGKISCASNANVAALQGSHSSSRWRSWRLRQARSHWYGARWQAATLWKLAACCCRTILLIKHMSRCQNKAEYVPA